MEEKNSKLVDILNHKIFKGFRQVKASKTFQQSHLKYIKVPQWEEAPLEPFEDNYNLQYKRTYLKSNDFITNPFTIHNYNTRSMKILSSSTKKKNVFFTENIRKRNKPNNEQKRLLKMIFQSKEEANKYNQIPLVPIEKKRKLDQDLLNDDFLFKISHHNTLVPKRNKPIRYPWKDPKDLKERTFGILGEQSVKCHLIEMGSQTKETLVKEQYIRDDPKIRIETEYTNYPTTFSTLGNGKKENKSQIMGNKKFQSPLLRYERIQTDESERIRRNKKKEKLKTLKQIFLNNKGI